MGPQGLPIMAVTYTLGKDAFMAALKGYELFAASTSSRQSEGRRLSVQVSIERYRLELYGRYMGLNGPETLLLNQAPQAQKLISAVIKDINTIFSDADELWGKYAIKVVRTATDDNEMGQLGHTRDASAVSPETQPDLTNVMASAHLEEDAEKTSTWSLKHKIRWVLGDDARAEKLLSVLRAHNESLWTTLSPHHTMMLEQGLPSLMLPGINDLAVLSAVKSYGHPRQTTSPLIDCSSLRASILTAAEDDPDPLALDQLKLDRKRDGIKIMRKSTDAGLHREMATISMTHMAKKSIVIEYKQINPNLGPQDKDLAKMRLKQLVRLLSQERPSGFGLLQTLGFLYEASDPLRFGMVFEISEIKPAEEVEVCSLLQVLSADHSLRQYGLEDRFAMALALVTAILQLHSSGWLHKNLKPENILFRQYGTSFPDITKPRIIGFGLSRPDRPEEKSLVESGEKGIDCYRHPDCQGPSPARSLKRHDYFSIGIILLIIGMWTPVEAILKEFKRKVSQHQDNPKQWAAYLVKYANVHLWPQCGNIYRDVTVRCLKGDFGMNDRTGTSVAEDRGIQRAFLFLVVDELSKCVV